MIQVFSRNLLGRSFSVAVPPPPFDRLPIATRAASYCKDVSDNYQCATYNRFLYTSIVFRRTFFMISYELLPKLTQISSRANPPSYG
jgi:hypothetical protein